jgi:hypothetical protein
MLATNAEISASATTPAETVIARNAKLTEPKAEVPQRLDLVEQVSITTTFGDSFLSSFSI